MIVSWHFLAVGMHFDTKHSLLSSIKAAKLAEPLSVSCCSPKTSNSISCTAKTDTGIDTRAATISQRNRRRWLWKIADADFYSRRVVYYTKIQSYGSFFSRYCSTLQEVLGAISLLLSTCTKEKKRSLSSWTGEYFICEPNQTVQRSTCKTEERGNI